MLDRRMVLTAGAAVFVAPAARAQDAAVSEAARALYANAVVIDGNIFPPVSDVMTKADVFRLKASGITAVKATVGGFGNDYRTTRNEIALLDRVIARYPTDFAQIRRAEDIAAAKGAGKLGIIYSFEGVAMLDGRIERIDEFARLDVKVMQLSYNLPSPFGAGVMSEAALGLTDLGREAIARMNALGVALDLSHANPATTAAAMAASAKPVLMTHGGCNAVHAHPRNKSDEQLRALAQSGGVFGIYDLPYLTPSPRQPTLDDYMAHMTNALNVCGEGHVGIGSDTDYDHTDTSPEALAAFERFTQERARAGVAAPGEDRLLYVEGLNHVRRCETIADALLRRRYSALVAEKVLGENFLRAFADIW
ncbi:MAG: dipeptidase [Caulobacteraceae bacterium]